jgi:hypothetical protein
MDEAFRASDKVLKRAAADKQVPWCSICLCTMIIASHTMVFMGNLETASAFSDIGVSTAGWSGVGLELATSLEHELEDVLKTVADMLTKAIGEIMDVTNLIDFITGYHAKAIDVVMSSNAAKALILLEAHGIMDSSEVGGISHLISRSMSGAVDKLSGSIRDAMKAMLDKLKPALIQVGKFIIKFGEKVQQIIESFSVTLDRVQKVFDQVMASMAGKGPNEALMMHQTFHMFDAMNTGAVTVDGLMDVGHLYDIPALQGSKSAMIIKKYDRDHSGDLDHEEFLMFVHGGDIPNVLSVVLRSFAKSLAKVSGQVGGAKFRAEIAAQTCDYLELMTAKNHTKVDWISDHLGNGSLPLPFVSGVLITLALKVDDPNTHKTVPTGAYTVSQIFNLHPKGFAKAFDNALNETFYLSQGYSADFFPVVSQRLTHWANMASAGKDPYSEVPAPKEGLLQKEARASADGKVGTAGTTIKVERKLLDTMEDMAYKVAEANMANHLADIQAEYNLLEEELFGSETAQFILHHMYAGQRVSVSKASTSNPALAATKSQILALPATLQFAKWLSWNASHTAKLFNAWSFKYQKTSSNAIDSFATQVQSMVKKIQGFIKMMMKYSTPDGIDQLENTLIDYAEAQMKAMLIVTKKRVNNLVARNAPSVELARDENERYENALGGPLGNGLAPGVEKELKAQLKAHGCMIPCKDKFAADKIVLAGNEKINKSFVDDTVHSSCMIPCNKSAPLTTAVLSDEITKLLGNVSDVSLASVSSSLDKHMKVSFLHVEVSKGLKALHKAGMGKADQTLMSQLKRDVQTALDSGMKSSRAAGSKLVEEDEEEGIVDILAELIDDALMVLNALTHALPQASKALIFAKKEVSMLSKTLENIFKVFETKGPELFDLIDLYYARIWRMYYFLMLTLPASLLFYAFWAGGFFGGPGTKVDQPRVRRPNALAKICGCIEDCCRCCCAAHEWQGYGGAECCFWSVILFLQFVVLLLFIMAILISIIAAVQFFLAAGCAQIYLLGDQTICGNVLSNLKMFLDTIFPGVAEFPDHCISKNLLTCVLIGKKMKTAAEYTVLGSFAAATFTFQMIVESGELHNRALTRIRFEQEWQKRHPVPEKKK